MAVVKAELMKLTSADGLIQFKGDEGVQLGKTYDVDLETREMVTLFNLERRCHHKKEIVWTTRGEWLPVECLKFLVS